MKTTKITYWVSTIIFSGMMAMSAVMYLTSPEIKAGFLQMGFPGFFRVELAIAKLIGAAVLLLPIARGSIKEWAYAGYFITLVSAFVAHISTGDPAAKIMGPLIFLAIFTVSYIAWHKVNRVVAA